MGEPNRIDRINTEIPAAEQANQPVTSQQPERPKLLKNAEAPVERAIDSKPMPLFSEADMNGFRTQWSNIQTGFVDEPRHTVEDADKLVASVLQRLADGFARERAGLEKQWNEGGDASTEDLRLALQRYRSFFDRLLKV